jgi:glyoxalase family protein
MNGRRGSDPRIEGIHHITAIASAPQVNLDFYTGFLGLRLVKRTVNFDDPGTYHFYYGDEAGRPGTILTFFPWPGARRGRHGIGQVTATSFSIPEASIEFWRERASRYGVQISEEERERFGKRVLSFSDPDGLALEFAATGQAGAGWHGSTIPAEHAIAGFAPSTLSIDRYEHTARLLVDTMGFRLTAQDGARYRFEVGNGGPPATVDLVCIPAAPRGSGGAGTVHHIAWRTPDDRNQRDWHTRIADAGLNVTPIIDRSYFRSIYFREPGGVLFEIATDTPGFTIDETLEELGSSLKLPPQYESARERIEGALPEIQPAARR